MSGSRFRRRQAAQVVAANDPQQTDFSLCGLRAAGNPVDFAEQQVVQQDWQFVDQEQDEQ